MDDPEYLQALKDDVVGMARKIVVACRSSDKRRTGFRDTIKRGNDSGGFGEPQKLLRVVTLLRDVETRWSATFLMIDRLLELMLVCNSSLF